jgi:heme exporter protein A
MAELQAAPLLDVRSLHVWRGEKHLLRGVSFTLRAGELLHVTGPNGVGKSTLLRAVCGLIPLEEGQISWTGKVLNHRDDAFDAQLAYLAHTNALKADLTAEENLRFEMSLRRKLDGDEISQALSSVNITHCAQLPMRVLSAGQRRRLALARVLLCKATLWILDEPTTNLDTAGVSLVEGLMDAHLKSGGAIITAAHHGLLAGHTAVRRLELQA